MKRIPSLRAILSLLLLVLTAGVVFLLTGCGGGAPGGDTPETSAESSSHDGDGERNGGTMDGSGSAEPHTFLVRGVIRELPDPRDPLSGLYIRHEAIDDWVGMDGEIQPMDSMTMPFPVSDDVTFEGIETGDKVTFTLVVDYDADPAIEVTEVQKLPADTELEFRSARPPE